MWSEADQTAGGLRLGTGEKTAAQVLGSDTGLTPDTPKHRPTDINNVCLNKKNDLNTFFM
jgi:hypothetical protein